MKISRKDWGRVHQKACDIANASESDDTGMITVHTKSMMEILDELEAKYGPRSQILATRADYLEDVSERRSLYLRALDLARIAQDPKEIELITDSIQQLDEEERAEPPDEANGLSDERRG